MLSACLPGHGLKDLGALQFPLIWTLPAQDLEADTRKLYAKRRHQHETTEHLLLHFKDQYTHA